jgi:dihydroxyacetone kinase-like protein
MAAPHRYRLYSNVKSLRTWSARLRPIGGAPLSELYLIYNDARQKLETAGCVIARSLVGNFVSSLDMAGCSVTVSPLDEELKQLWDAPVHTAAQRPSV